MDGPGAEVQNFNCSDLSTGVGFEYLPTGYAEPGVVNFSLFFDPVAPTLQALTDLIATPAVSVWKIIWPDTGNTEWDFSGIFTGLNPQVDMADGLKADCSIQLSGLVSYPTTP